MDDNLTQQEVEQFLNSKCWKLFLDDIEFGINITNQDLIDSVESSKEYDNFLRGKLKALISILDWEFLLQEEVKQSSEEDDGKDDGISKSKAVWRTRFGELGSRIPGRGRTD